MSNNSINLVSLDFDTLKADFIEYLRTNTQFRDFDFAGSNISVLLDVLAYNSFKNGFFLNMVASETHLGSAQLRGSVLSRAKDLNYTPRSARSSKARISVSFTATGDNQPYIIPKGSSFTTLVKNNSFVFTMPETISVASANSTFTFETDIYEGRYLQDSYIIDASIANPKLKITNKNVDTTSITVTVFEDNETDGQTYVYATSLLGLNENSKVFFLQAGDNDYYEIIFGDNIVGKRPKNNSLVKIDYRISSFNKADGARQFSINFDPTNPEDELLTTPVVTIVTPAIGGADVEDIDSIKYYAPRHFQIQERAVVADDYPIILKEKFPEINAINVFGGEDLSPPQFGKVFVSVDISNVDGFPDSKKSEYYSFLRSKMPLSIIPVFIEPTFLYYKINSLVKYNLNLTSATIENIRTSVINSIIDFNEVNLDDFNSTLYFSKLIANIDDSDTSIISNSTKIEIYKKVDLVLNELQNLVVEFNVPLMDNIPEQGNTHPTNDIKIIRSTLFNQHGETYFLEDNGQGIIRVMKNSGSNSVRVYDIGTVDYSTGIVRINNFEISGFEGVSFKIYAIPADSDITSSKNTIFTIEPDEISINVVPVRE